MANTFSTTYTGDVEQDETMKLYDLCAKGMVTATKRGNMAFANELKDGLKEMLEEAGKTFSFRILLDLCCEYEAQA